MTQGKDKEDVQPASDGLPQGGGRIGGDSLQDASEEAVRFMEEGDEPGHAGRGDGG